LEIEKKKYWLLLCGLFIGIVFDIFFYDKTLGISYPVFTVLVLIIAAFLFWGKYGELSNRDWLWALPVMALSITFLLYSNQILKVLNFLIIPYLLIMLISLVSKTNSSNWADIRFIGDFFKRLFIPFGYVHMPFVTLSRMDNKSGENWFAYINSHTGYCHMAPVFSRYNL